MYPAYLDGRIHEINRNVAGLLLIVALFIDLAGVLKGLAQAKIIKKSVILFWLLNMTI